MKVLRFSDVVSSGFDENKRVFILADRCVPQDEAGNIIGCARIQAAIPALRQGVQAGATVMMTSHLCHPTEGELKEKDNLTPVARRLSALLSIPDEMRQNWIDGVDVFPGQAVLFENCRVALTRKSEKNSAELPQEMAKLYSIYVNDAFGTAHGIAQYAFAHRLCQPAAHG